MGFLCEAPRGAAHNRWARPQPRQACPSHEEERKAGGRRGGRRGKYSLLAVLYSLFPPLCPSILLFPPKNKIYFFLQPLPPFSPFSLFHWPLSSVELRLWHIYMYPSTRARGEKQISEKHTRREKKKGGREGGKSRSAAREKDKVNCQHNTGLGFEEKKKAGVEGEEPAVNPSPSTPTSPLPCGSGMQPLFSVLNKPFK